MCAPAPHQSVPDMVVVLEKEAERIFEELVR